MIVLDMSDKRPLYEQVFDRFKDLIEKNVLKADEQMPSVRALSMELSINPNTIQRAYAELERAGYIYPVKGRGNFVADISGILPARIEEFYDDLESILKKAAIYEIQKDDVIAFVDKYYEYL